MLKLISSSLAIIALVAVGSVLAGSPRWHELPTAGPDGKSPYTFKQWTNDFNRMYPEGSTEYKKREAIFNSRLQSILAHNDDASQHYKRGVNQFSDWTDEEWKRYNRLRADETSTHDDSEIFTSDVDAIHRIKTFEANAATSMPPPQEVDYRQWNAPRVLTGIKNQGYCGNCWAHSATQGVESAFALLTSQLPVLSTQQITSCTESMDGCGGGSIRAGWSYLENTTGLNEEWVYPFVDFFTHDHKNDTQKCLNITEKFLPNFSWWPKAQVTGYYKVKRNDANATMRALAELGPLSIGVASALWMDYEGGILHNNKSHGAYATWDNWGIDHAVQLVGYGHDAGLKQSYWIVRNSWGTTWGELGFIRLYRPAVEPCGIYPVNNKTVCGTSSVLADPYIPFVKVPSKVN